MTLETNKWRGLEEKTELVSGRVHVLDDTNVTIDLNVCWAGIPLSLHGLYWRGANLMEFCRHVLLFRDAVYRVIVHEDLQSLLVDADGACHFRRFNLDLHGDGAHKLLYGALHEINGAEVIIIRLSTCDSWLHEETRHYRIVSICWLRRR